MKKKTLSILTVADAFVLTIAILLNVIFAYAGVAQGNFPAFSYVVTILLILTAVFAVYYILAGCKKAEGASYFKWFMYVFAFAKLMTLLGHREYPTVNVLLIGAITAVLSVLSLARDLGYKKSFILASAAVVCTIVQFIVSAAAGALGTEWVPLGTQLLLALTALLMVGAKYMDKKERGTK